MKNKLLLLYASCLFAWLWGNPAKAQTGNWSGVPTTGVCPGQSTALTLGSLPSTITNASNPVVTGCRVTSGPTVVNNNGVVTVALTVVWLVGNDEGTIEMELVNTSNNTTTYLKHQKSPLASATFSASYLSKSTEPRV